MLTKKREPWWLSGLECQSIARSMIKVEGSNPGLAVLFRELVCFEIAGSFS